MYFLRACLGCGMGYSKASREELRRDPTIRMPVGLFVRLCAMLTLMPNVAFGNATIA
jgi:hypothetical protein